jgi:hypothetical protein
MSQVSFDGAEENAVDGRRRVPIWPIVAGIAVLAVGAVAAAITARPGHHHAAPAPTPRPSTTNTVDVGAGTATDLAAGSGVIFVLTASPPALDRIEALTGRLAGRVPVPRGAGRVVVDHDGAFVWVTVGRVVLGYEAQTLAPIGQVRLPRPVFAAAPLDGRLFLATDRGIYVIGPARESRVSARLLPGFDDAVQAISSDPARGRLLAISQSGAMLIVDDRRVRVAGQVRAESVEAIEVTDVGLWTLGFGSAGGTRVQHLDPLTLKTRLVDAGNPELPPNARGWPGASVFWVNAPNTGATVCHDGRTGNVGGVFTNLDGPIVSSNGVTYGVSNATVVRISTTATCPG